MKSKSLLSRFRPQTGCYPAYHQHQVSHVMLWLLSSKVPPIDAILLFPCFYAFDRLGALNTEGLRSESSSVTRLIFTKTIMYLYPNLFVIFLKQNCDTHESVILWPIPELHLADTRIAFGRGLHAWLGRWVFQFFSVDQRGRYRIIYYALAPIQIPSNLKGAQSRHVLKDQRISGFASSREFFYYQNIILLDLGIIDDVVNDHTKKMFYYVFFFGKTFAYPAKLRFLFSQNWLRSDLSHFSTSFNSQVFAAKLTMSET